MGRVNPLRHDALQAHRTGPPEQSGALCTLDMAGEPNHVVVGQQVRQSPAALVERHLAEVLAVEREKVSVIAGHVFGMDKTAQGRGVSVSWLDDRPLGPVFKPAAASLVQPTGLTSGE
jgi:hypothetical protein